MDSNEKIKPKENLISQIIVGVILIFLAILATDIRQFFGISVQYRILTGSISLILLTWSILVIIKKSRLKKKLNLISSLPFQSQPLPKEPTDKFGRPKYILYKNFCWEVRKNTNKNKYWVALAPLCPKCRIIPIVAQRNEWDGYNFDCLNCNTNFDRCNFFDIRRSLFNILLSQGFKFFDTLYNKPSDYNPELRDY